MSRAFVKEPDGDEIADDLPERKISSHPNYVTPRGQQLLQDKLQQAESERRRLEGKEEMPAKQGSCPCRKRAALSEATSYAGNFGDPTRK